MSVCPTRFAPRWSAVGAPVEVPALIAGEPDKSTWGLRLSAVKAERGKPCAACGVENIAGDRAVDGRAVRVSDQIVAERGDSAVNVGR